MQIYHIGQRWISNAEPQLGLGTIINYQNKRIEVDYPASEEKRLYTEENAPLIRVIFGINDQITTKTNQQIKITALDESGELILYKGLNQQNHTVELIETEISDHTTFSQPAERLFSGLFDANRWFGLRYSALSNQQQLAASAHYGFVGARATLIPHQLYIASQVATRQNPRVLLADEVGLGKTIEAGLILHYQFIHGLIHRVLIVVPDALVHQWFIECVRRFNLKFSIFDDARCHSACESQQVDNPFITEQLILCPLSLLTEHPARLLQASAVDWDMLIVDEAHHLAWEEDQPSEEYEAIELLSAVAKGVLLLTATPEQLGRNSHFARLRLLDPDRYYDMQAFLEEESHFAPIAEAAEQLLGLKPLDQDHLKELLTELDEIEQIPLIAEIEKDQSVANILLDTLLDRHGTGRSLFRNTRQKIKGFPQRKLHAYPLTAPEQYEKFNEITILEHLQPEHLFRQYHDYSPQWWQVDPRFDWLIERLNYYTDEKILLICAQAQTVIDLEAALRTEKGIQASVFHENMDLIERDRGAAWFSDPDGCRILLCSEIGSEGRNFQFAHHLVLFDLPSNPELLEQRIGRLDRIGQTSQVDIHVPYFENHPSEVMFKWFHQGLNSFEIHSPSGFHVYQQLRPAISEAMEYPESLDMLIQETRILRDQINLDLEAGRDHLIELSSFRENKVTPLINAIQEDEARESLRTFVNLLCRNYGIEMEEHSHHTWILKPSKQMLTSDFHNLPEDGMTVTSDRNKALSNENWQFLTWEHPFIQSSLEQVIDSTEGRTACGQLVLPGIPEGILLECLFVLDCPAAAQLQIGRFLPPTLLRSVSNNQGQQLAKVLPFEKLNQLIIHVKRKVAVDVTQQTKELIKTGLAQAQKNIQNSANSIKEKALNQAMDYYNNELIRLKSLQKTNPSIDAQEINNLKEKQAATEKALKQADIRLDAVRVILCTNQK